MGVCNLTRELLRRGRWDELVKEVREFVDGGLHGASYVGEPLLHLAVLAAWRGDHDEAARLAAQAEEEITDDPQDAARRAPMGW